MMWTELLMKSVSLNTYQGKIPAPSLAAVILHSASPFHAPMCVLWRDFSCHFRRAHQEIARHHTLTG